MNLLALVVWAVLLLAVTVAALLIVVGILLIVRALVRRIRKWHRDRYLRARRKGKWVARCDFVVTPPTDSSRRPPRRLHCDRLAHWMVIGPNIDWGTGEKRCWRHLRRNAYMLGDQNIYMPVNRNTAWVTDPPPSKREDADV